MKIFFRRQLPLACCFAGLFASASAQKPKPRLFLNQPEKDYNRVSVSRQYISGSTCAGCRLTLNGDSVYVYPTGAFAIQVDLKEGDTTLLLTAFDSTGNAFTRNIFYRFTRPLPPAPVKDFSIESIATFPEGNILVSPGDTIRVRAKARPGVKATWLNGLPLKELPPSQGGGIPGIYAGSYAVQPGDPLINGRLKITIRDDSGRTFSRESASQFRVLDKPLIATTYDDLGYLTYTTTGDRLGPVKMGYLDSAVLLSVTGKINVYYKVRLSAAQTAYITDVNVDLLKDSADFPRSAVSSMETGSSAKFDYIVVGLEKRLPYRSFEQPDSSSLLVDIYGAATAKKWSAALQGDAEVKSFSTQQIEPDVFRIAISLKHPQYWGHDLYYSGNDLVIRVKHAPPIPDLAHLTIGVDAGHGGPNTGARGPTGIYEKMLTLPIALKLAAALEKEGAHVIMDRFSDTTFNNDDRLEYFRKANPDILISIHLNSSGDPLHISGTATYYKYPGNRGLAESIYRRMQQTGLKGFTCQGDFNFILNEPTEFPNVLVETLFLSNPADEMKALDDGFQQQMAEAIVQGLRDYLAEVRAANGQ